MATNDFLPFAAAGGANVLAQADWLALATRLSGYTAGVANSAQINKGLRQAAAVAAAFGQLLNDYGELDALDDGNIGNLVRDFARSIQAGKFAYVVATGTANAWTVAPTPAVATYAAGRVLNIIAPATNSSATVNANISGLGNRRIKKADGNDPAIGDLIASRIYATIDDGANIRILTPLPSDYSQSTSQEFITASKTFIVPASTLLIEGVGGGGAGGASGDGSTGIAGNMGGGGGGGGFFRKLISGLVVGSSITATVGLGGTPVNNAAGNAGGSTSFGAHATGAGGGSGTWGSNTAATSGVGGTGTGGDINIQGGVGGLTGPNSGTVTINDALRLYGRGGQAASGLSLVDLAATGQAGRGYGAGGSGASGGSGLAGGAGAPGYIWVRW